jgi:hypothetical protein
VIGLPTVEIAPLSTIWAWWIHLKLQIWKPYNNFPIVGWLIRINPKIATQTVGLNCQNLTIIFQEEFKQPFVARDWKIIPRFILETFEQALKVVLQIHLKKSFFGQQSCGGRGGGGID